MGNHGNHKLLGYEANKKKLFRAIKLQAQETIFTVKLFGILLESTEIILGEGIILRQSTKTDLERSESLYGSHAFLNMPSAILEIKDVYKRQA